MSGKTVNLIIPPEVIEESIDRYLTSVFGREVVWEDDLMPYKYLVTVSCYFAEPYDLDTENLEVEDEWWEQQWGCGGESCEVFTSDGSESVLDE